MEKTSNDKIMNEDDDDEADATELTMMADGIIKWSSGTIREDIEGKVRSFLKAKVYSELKFVPDETFATILLKKAVRQHVIFKFAEKIKIDIYAKKNHRMTYNQFRTIWRNSESMMRTRYHSK